MTSREALPYVASVLCHCIAPAVARGSVSRTTYKVVRTRNYSVSASTDVEARLRVIKADVGPDIDVCEDAGAWRINDKRECKVPADIQRLPLSMSEALSYAMAFCSNQVRCPIEGG